jgi:hypothetical protein
VKEDPMENNNKLKMLDVTFINRETGEEVEDITIMIDGKFKQALNIFVDNCLGILVIMKSLVKLSSALLNK